MNFIFNAALSMQLQSIVDKGGRFFLFLLSSFISIILSEIRPEFLSLLAQFKACQFNIIRCMPDSAWGRGMKCFFRKCSKGFIFYIKCIMYKSINYSSLLWAVDIIQLYPNLLLWLGLILLIIIISQVLSEVIILLLCSTQIT